MHQCLEIYDIRECICQHLAYTNSLDALTKLARTCSAFLDPALNALWHTIPSLEPLVRCLPDDAWAVRQSLWRNPVLTLNRQTTHQDWERCKFYAHRIRHYGAEDDDIITLDQMKGATQTDKTFYLAFKPPSDLDYDENHPTTAPNPSPLLSLPNLQSCRLIPHTHDPIPHYSPFLAPTLRSLDLRLPSPLWVGDTTIIGLLRSLPVACPLLQKLCLYGVKIGLVTFPGPCSGQGAHDEREVDELLVNALRGLRHLESIQCPYIWFPAEAVKHFARHMKLRSLSMKNTAENVIDVLKNDVQEGRRRDVYFEYLEDLGVDCSPRGGLLEVIELLGYVANAARLRVLEVARTGGIPTETEIRGFIQSLADLTVQTTTINGARVNSSLRSLQIHQGDETGFLTPDELPTPIPKYTTTLSTLSPLLDFINLAELSIMVETRFSLDDDDARQMARAWPKLKQLELGYCGGGWGREGKTFTLEGLRAFARYCPGLEELGVSVTITSSQLAPTIPDVERDVDLRRTGAVGGSSSRGDETGACCHKLRYLDLGDSVYFGEPERVAQCLLDIFPSLSRVYGPSMAMSPEWEKKWMRVSKLVHEMQALLEYSRTVVI
ncbi:hypothetical protein NP233_g2647 [Leucocoprinus birnbaumii]|uniref:F-box domain-containing protein n=1 Tax=Leucocoprinus birnbaumii TaxID=56174 RepID=A0AAD5YYX1_9AGAR|nr:hypothetical protein NP233_g2647 [Leucocoprinus birnbaumii]